MGIARRRLGMPEEYLDALRWRLAAGAKGPDDVGLFGFAQVLLEITDEAATPDVEYHAPFSHA
jgi:hypothetical protein